MTPTLQTSEGYLMIPIKLSRKSAVSHQLFVKRHETHDLDADPNKPTDRTLIILNVPPFVCKESIKRVFSGCGRIRDVFLHSKPTSKAHPPVDSFTAKHCSIGFQVAYVVFHKIQSLSKALEPSTKYNATFYDDDDASFSGVPKWCSSYGEQYLDADKLMIEINGYMEKYDNRVHENIVAEKAQDGVADDEGWITVTKHSKTKTTSRTETSEKRAQATEKRKRKRKELADFYAFQQRQSKRDDIARLRKQFEEDKSTIEQMKVARKFKPF